MELLDSKTLRSEGAKAGLIFGTLSGGYIFLSQWLSGMGQAAGIVNLILEVAKITGLIVLMRHYMLSLKTVYDGVDRGQVFRFGLYTAFYSAMITAACAYIAYAYVFPEAVAETMDVLRQSFGKMMDSNTLRSLELMENKFPLYAFFSNGIWCLLYGTVLSFILSRTLPEGTMTEEEEEEEDDEQ